MAFVVSCPVAIRQRGFIVATKRVLWTSTSPSSTQVTASNEFQAVAAQASERRFEAESKFEAAAPRRQILAALLAFGAGYSFAGTATAADAKLTEALIPFLKAKALLDGIPEKLKAEKWDGIRTIFKTPPVKDIELIMAKAAQLLPDSEDAYEKLDDAVDGIRDCDSHLYLLAVQFPNEENKANFLRQANKAQKKLQVALDEFVSLFPEEELAAAKKAL